MKAVCHVTPIPERNAPESSKVCCPSYREGAPDGCEFVAEDATAQRAEDRLRHLAATDALTGLANYRRLSEAVESEIKRSERTARAFAVLIFDLNGMKRINDQHGHLAGNCALCRLADIFRSSCRSIDTAARYGGDEFAIVLPETGAKEADAVGRRICERLSNDLLISSIKGEVKKKHTSFGWNFSCFAAP